MLFRVLLSCLLAFSLISCTTTPLSKERNPAGTQTYYVDPQYDSLLKLVTDALTFRAKSLQFAQAKKLDTVSNITLTREEGDWLRDMGVRYLDTRQKLMQLAVRDGELFEGTKEVILAPGKGTRKIIQQGPGMGSSVKKEILYVDPTDSLGEQYIFRIQMSLAAALILMDNYMVAIKPYNENNALRYLLNYDQEQRQVLDDIARSYATSAKRKQIVNGTIFVDKVMEWRRKQVIATSPEETQLYTLTQSSIWYLQIKNGTAGSGFWDSISNIWNRLTSSGKYGLRSVSFGLSMGFGNMVGLVESRKGYLYTMPENEKKGLIAEMKPLDILLEKTPFRLTDKMIPGHYGHVAIWIGTEEQLKDLQVWEKIPAKIQEKIRAGHRIVEALRPGVQINTLNHFLNVDDFLVLRDVRPNISDEYRRKAILQAIAQIGKEYDFNFDVQTHTRIVCSEIAYVVYADVKWPLEETLRRYTISPDNVAQLAYKKGAPFTPITMYYNGKRVYKDLPYSLSLLLKDTDESRAEFERFHNL